jgi:hypothetical protein
MRYKTAFITGLLICWTLSPTVKAATYCPESVGQIENSKLTDVAQDIFSKLYAELGCSTPFISLPGKRLLHSFNQGKVKGEALRFSIIEQHYSREFVRSKTPLITSTNAIWQHPEPTIAKIKPLGTVLGIVWQEKYLEESKEAGQKAIQFYSYKQVFDAYNRGTIGSFLIESSSLNLEKNNTHFIPMPVMGETVDIAQLYHYLAIEYSDFMHDFSALVQESKAFSKL